VVADSFSTDATVEIARRYTKPDRAGCRSRDSAAAQRGARSADRSWVFSLDADERCTEARPTKSAARRPIRTRATPIWCPRRNYVFGRLDPPSGYFPTTGSRSCSGAALAVHGDAVHETYTLEGSRGAFCANRLRRSRFAT